MINTNIQWEDSPKSEKKNYKVSVINNDVSKHTSNFSKAHELDFNTNFDEEKEKEITDFVPSPDIKTNKSMKTNLTNKINNIHSNIYLNKS